MSAGLADFVSDQSILARRASPPESASISSSTVVGGGGNCPGTFFSFQSRSLEDGMLGQDSPVAADADYQGEQYLNPKKEPDVWKPAGGGVT